MGAEKTPWEVVLDHVDFPTEINGLPFIPEPKQIEVINQRALNQDAAGVGIRVLADAAGLWLDMGTGKTFVSTAIALYWMIMGCGACVVIMPPNLLIQWQKWLRLIKYKETGQPLDVVLYAGLPAKRKLLSLDADFVLVGVHIFKRDFTRFSNFFYDRPFTLLVDEATFIANINSANHEAVFDFGLGRPKQLLSGTPANAPLDAYGLIKFTAPGTYLNFVTFRNLHVEKVDDYDRPTEWKNLGLLHDNLLKNSTRILYEDMYPGEPRPLFDVVYYDLSEEHQKLYRRLAEEQLLELPDGGKIDATTVHRLRHALGQIVLNQGHFCGDPSKGSVGLDMIEERLHALQGGKMVVFAHYKMTIANIVKRFQRYGAVGYNSEVSDKQKEKNKERFIEDRDCKLIAIQYVSGGKGLDGLQHVSHTALCAEPCRQPRDFHQAIRRLRRRGQRKRVHVLLPIARGTVQVKGFNALLDNDTLINQVVRNAIDLRKEIYGEDQPELRINVDYDWEPDPEDGPPAF